MSPTADDVRGKRVAVVGLGRSGLAAARRLLSSGANVVALDASPAEKLGREAQLLGAAGVDLRCGGHRAEDFDGVELIVLSPGVPLTIPGLAGARARGVPVCSEIDLAAPLVEGRVISITGSNGKSTTTAWVGAMLAAAGRDGVPCANFGVPFCDAVQGDHPGRWYAAEISSFQLDITFELRAAAGIYLNLQPDHLDRHGSVDAYRLAKERIAELLAPGAPLVLVTDDPAVADFAERQAATGRRVLEVSAEREIEQGGCVSCGQLVLRLGGHEEALADAAALPLPGLHNRQNALAAAVACRAAGVPLDAVRRGLLSFKGLSHRIQDVAQVGGVRYVDDSKATNVGSVLVALRAVSETLPAGQKIVVLLGGRDKDSDFRPLAPALDALGARAVTFGEAGPLIADVLAREGFAAHRAGSLADAVQAARGLANPGDVVLLSPACASFDAFTGYAARGEAFAAEVRRFAEEPA